MTQDETANRFMAERRDLVATLARHVTDTRVLAAIATVPRHAFVTPENLSAAYANAALAIGHSQTISQPLIVAQMTAALDLSPGDRVLEVGTGSGYQAAVLSLLASEVITVERIPALEASARDRLARLGYENVRVEPAGERLGFLDGAPYDAILVAAGAPNVPADLMEQLGAGGRMVIPVGKPGEQELALITRTQFGDDMQKLGGCAFVPLIGRGAWPQRR